MENKEILKNLEELIQETFSDPQKMRSFLATQSKMYDTSYSNVLILKSQKENVSKIFSKEEVENNKYKIKDGELPLNKIARVKDENGKYQYITKEVYDISQLDISTPKETKLDKEYVENIIKNMCKLRKIDYSADNQIENISNIVSDISSNCRNDSASKYNLDLYIEQIKAENIATTFVIAKKNPRLYNTRWYKFVIAKKLNISTKNYSLKTVCDWGIDKDIKTLKESLRYIQKISNYFNAGFEMQKKRDRIENMQEEEEME